MVLHAVALAIPVRALETLCLFRQLFRVVLTIATTKCGYIPGDANVDDVDGLAVRVGTDDVGHVALAFLRVGATAVLNLVGTSGRYDIHGVFARKVD